METEIANVASVNWESKERIDRYSLYFSLSFSAGLKLVKKVKVGWGKFKSTTQIEIKPNPRNSEIIHGVISFISRRNSCRVRNV